MHSEPCRIVVTPPPYCAHGRASVKLRAVTVGLLHPGEMGAALGAVLSGRGESVLWASSGRSAATAERARAAGLEDVGTVDELAGRSDLVLAVCPPAAAVNVARSVLPFDGIYVDANAVSPATARRIAGLVARYADGGIVGPPPREPGTTRLYLSGEEAQRVADLFADTIVDAPVVPGDIAAASAVKMTYAAWTKGTAALLLAIRAAARVEGVDSTLLEEWRMSLPELPQRSTVAARSAVTKGWRWVGEMEEIADTFAAVGLPDGFHRAAAEIYRRSPHAPDAEPSLERVLAALAAADPSPVSGEVEGNNERRVRGDENRAGGA
jgi:3-hydroxyisobutyrate dehydrogenase-like beta-hydroxyacid dehydrogenase